MESREDVEKPCSFPCRGRRSILLSAWKSERVCLALRIHLSRRQIVNPFFFSCHSFVTNLSQRHPFKPYIYVTIGKGSRYLHWRWSGGHVGSRVYFMNARFVAFDGYQSARTRFSIRRKINCDSRQGKLQHGSGIINRDTGNKLVNRIETQASGSCFFFALSFFFFFFFVGERWEKVNVV